METTGCTGEGENFPHQDFKPEKLTIEQLKSFPGCENYNEEEAKEIIATLYQLAIILFDGIKNNDLENNTLEDQKIAA